MGSLFLAVLGIIGLLKAYPFCTGGGGGGPSGSGKDGLAKFKDVVGGVPQTIGGGNGGGEGSRIRSGGGGGGGESSLIMSLLKLYVCGQCSA